jgi:ABC-2 type transport system ATP-binding protein
MISKKLIIDTQQLTFGYNKNRLVLDNINLKVEKGSIYGFLGPNGAGKTTTIRLLLGLLIPQSGNISLFDKPLSKNQIEIFRRVGAMIETPSLYEHLTGFDNLEITRKLKRIKNSRIKDVLEIVKLTNVAKTKVKQYSLGMKQRLGLAIALLSEPPLLILDEPTNGLDPHGIIETRELLLDLNRNFATTILVSSHLLAEIEKLVTHVGIINKGKLIFQNTIQELQNQKEGHAIILINTNNNKQALAFLQTENHAAANKNEIIEVAYKDNEQIAEICKLLVNSGLDVYQLETVNNNLEEIFLEITNK